MQKTFATIAAGFAALILSAASAMAAPAVDLSHPAFAPVTTQTSVPVGAAEFCKTYSSDCLPNIGQRDMERLTEQSWAQLVAVNDYVNRTVTPVSDQDLYNVVELWTYPDGQGDCEDFALEKRRQLIAAGWSPGALMIAVVRQTSGEGHAVLMVRTDRGDLVLDNQDGRVLVWMDTPYEYIKRQSQADPRKWVGITDTRVLLASR